MEKVFIKDVATYLRKSRGDIDSDLDKHRTILEDMCTKNGWKATEYKEIETGDSIFLRPVLQELLEDIRNGLWDAVLVVDIDRLGRGDQGDQDTIKKAFARSDTLIVTPDHTYNLDDENDEFQMDVKGFFSHLEYKMIVRRFMRGKKVGARKGMWTNGTPPYPYEYQKYNDKFLAKGLVVNDEKLKTYRFIIDSIVQLGKPPEDIMYELNRLGIPSPSGGKWWMTTIRRIAIDQTHLGMIISNKSKGNGHAKKKESAKEYVILPKANWVAVKGEHEPVKTQEEHEKILIFFSRLTNAPKRKPKIIRPLTGLVKCDICGCTMTTTKDDKYSENINRCWQHSATGEACPNRGGKTKGIYSAINATLAAQKLEIETAMSIANIDGDTILIENKIAMLQDELSKKEKAIDRILEAFEAGVYSLPQFKERKGKAEESVASTKSAIDVLYLELKHKSLATKEQKLSAINRFFNEISRPEKTDAQRNELYKSVVKEVRWLRDRQKTEIHVIPYF